jgi:hypothetical protein
MATFITMLCETQILTQFFFTEFCALETKFTKSDLLASLSVSTYRHVQPQEPLNKFSFNLMQGIKIILSSNMTQCSSEHHSNVSVECAACMFLKVQAAVSFQRPLNLMIYQIAGVIFMQCERQVSMTLIITKIVNVLVIYIIM